MLNKKQRIYVDRLNAKLIDKRGEAWVKSSLKKEALWVQSSWHVRNDAEFKLERQELKQIRKPFGRTLAILIVKTTF